MQKADIALLLNYSNWATERILTAAQAISQEQFVAAATPNPGHGGLRGTLVHLLDTEFSWRMVVQHGQYPADLDEADFPDVTAIATRWHQERDAWLAYVDSLDDQKLSSVYTYQFGDGPKRSRLVWQTIAHVVNHSTQHRSEAAAMLTGFGSSPGELGLNYFLHEHPEYVPGASGATK